MKTGCEKRLDQSFYNAPILIVHPQTKIVLFSDCHRGIGNNNDNFFKNQHLYLAALHYYYHNGFIYIELGDGDELWENRSLAAIKEIHSEVFGWLSLFRQENRLYMLFGNHDHILKDDPEFLHTEGLILKFCNPKPTTAQKPSHCPELYLTHGHQADALNSTFWKFSRFLVRYLWKPLEQIGILDPTSAAKNYRHRKRSEKRLSAWAVKNNCYLITGHTHRPMLNNPQNRYFNTGSCVHPYGITCLEIENHAISLVKWSVQIKEDNTLFVDRTLLSEPLLL